MDREIINEFVRVGIMDKIRRSIINHFVKKWDKWRRRSYYKKIKEIKDLIANILFFREKDDFFPIINKSSDKWKYVVRNKFKYITKHKYRLYLFNDEINFIEREFITKYSQWYNKKRKIIEIIKRVHDGNIHITSELIDSKYVIKNNVFSNTIFYVDKELYKKLINSINQKKIINEITNERIIFLTFMRYEKLLNSENHQLGVNYKKYEIYDYDVELFASPINRTLQFFCSAYPDIDKYYKGNIGTYKDNTLISSMKYTMNPPYIDQIMIDSIEHILSELNKKSLHDVMIFITIPIWDIDTIKNIVHNSRKRGEYLRDYESVLVNNHEWEPYIPLELLKNSKYLYKIITPDIGKYLYYNHKSRKQVSISRTFHIILKKD